MVVEISCKTKKWGSSIGIIIPKDIVDKERIKLGDKIIVEIKKRPIAKEFFGMLSEWKEDPQKLKDEARKGWD